MNEPKVKGDGGIFDSIGDKVRAEAAKGARQAVSPMVIGCMWLTLIMLSESRTRGRRR